MNRRLDLLPEITLRIPGYWESLEQCVSQLPPCCRVREDRLHVDDGPGLSLAALPADGEFPHVFRISARRPATQKELQQVADYRMNVGLIGRGGSMAAARRIMGAAAAVIEAGGAGVFIDNSLMSHGGEDWLELHRHSDDRLAVYYTFVNIVRRSHGIESFGMQALGRRDCQLELSEDEEQFDLNLEAFEDFLRACCHEEEDWMTHDRFFDAAGREFALEPIEDGSLFHAEHPIVNPYGRWRMRQCGVES